MVETNYEFIKKENETIRKFIKKGLIPIHIMTWKTMYEYYVSERKEGKGKMLSYQNTAKNYNVADETVRKMVYWMNSTD